MNCALTVKQQELLLSKVFKDIESASKTDQEFNVDDYIQNFHDTILERTNDPALALTYAQMLPEFIQLSFTGEKEMQKSMKNKGLSFDSLIDKIDEFETMTNVQKAVSPSTISNEALENLDADIEQDAKRIPLTPPLNAEEVKDQTQSLVDVFSFKVLSPLTITGQQTLKVKDLTDAQIKSIYFNGEATDYQIETYRKNNSNKASQIKDPEQDFYYDFFELFQDEFLDNTDPSTIQIKNHTGFKLQLVSKKVIPVEKARLDEQRFAQEKGIGAYNAGVGAVITDNNNNILYFDKDYNSSTDESVGRPLYYNIRKVELIDGKYTTKSKIQSIKEISENLGVTLDKAEKMQQEQLKELYNLREEVMTKDTGPVNLDITGVSRGVLNIRFEEKGTKINDIDWVNSDINLNLEIATLDAEELGEKKGGVYVRVPGYRSIPVQADNLSSEDIDKTLDLLFNKDLVGKDGLAVDAKTRIKLAKHLLYTKKNTFEFYEDITDGRSEVRVKLNGKIVTEENKAEIKAFLTQPFISSKNKTSTIHKTTFGQYVFSSPKTGQQFEEFSIQDNILSRTPVSLDDHITNHASLAIVPNNTGDSKIISFLNGYMTFDTPKLTPKTTDINVAEQDSPGDIEAGKTEVTPEEKAARTLANIDEIDPLTMMSVRLNPMKSTPKEIAKAKKWWNEHPLSKYIGYEELFNVVNSNAWAEFVDGGIKLYAGSNHTVLYHEAFHAFTQHFLSKKDKLRLYSETAKLSKGQAAIKAWARKKSIDVKSLSQHEKYLAIEELLAEGFRQYVLSDGKVLGKTPVRNTIFRRILNFLKKLFGSNNVEDTNLLNIEEIYAQLYIGNINNYSPSSKNSFFGDRALASRPEAVEGQVIGIDEQDAALIVESMNGIIAARIEYDNNSVQDILPGSTPYTTATFNNPDVFLKRTYNVVKNAFINKEKELKEKVKTLDGDARDQVQRQLLLLNDVINNFGDYDTNTGIIAYHKEKSQYLQEQVKNMDKDAFRTTKADVDATRFDIAGNELNTIKSGSDRVQYLMGSILKHDENGFVEENELGFPIVMTIDEVFGKVASIIGDQHASPREMLTALEKAVDKNPWVESLINKLGAVSTPSTVSQNLWTGLWYTLHVSIQKLHAVMINDVTDEGGPRKFEILSGNANAVFRKVEQDFKSSFKVANHRNRYIVDGGPIGNVLDTKAVIRDFKGKLSRAQGKFDFLRAIGFPLTENDQIKEGVDKSYIGVNYIFNKIESLDALGIPITDTIAILRDTVPTPVEGKFLRTENSNVNKILSLEAEHSGKYSNFSVLSAKGNVVQEYSKMSTVGEMVMAINRAKTFSDLINDPAMAHLDYANNPRVTKITLLRSIFKYDENTDSFGEKLKGVTGQDAHLRFDIADGIINIEDERTSKEFSTATSNSTSYDRLLQDLYSMVLEGKPSAINPADKNTITIITGSQLITEGSENKNVYIDFNAFNQVTAEGNNLGIQNAYKILLPHIEGELTEMMMINTKVEGLPHVPGYTVENNKGIARGKDFSTFDGVFSKGTKKLLKEEFADAATQKKPLGRLQLDTISPQLRDKVIAELTEYFDKTTKQTISKLDQMLYVDTNLEEIVTKGLDRKLTKKELSDVILKAYTTNKFIHNVEHTILFYGSPAQFKDLDKRAPGLNSTGRMFRTDSDMINHLNTIIKRPYQQSQLGTEGAKFSETVGTAIVRDEILDSDYIKKGPNGEDSHYVTEVRKDLEKRGMGEAKIKDAIKSLNAYSGMEVGDAQGWISFDAYRAYSIAEDRWSPQQEALFNKIIKSPEDVKMGEIAEYFPVRKYQYFGPLAVGGLHTTAFHKFSLLPLIPIMTQGTKLAQLHTMMMEQGIDYVTYQTGSKVSTITAKDSDLADNLFEKDGILNTKMSFTNNPIHLKYLKDQLDINSEFKGKVIFSTQLRKLILEGLVAEGMPADYKGTKEEWDSLSPKDKLKNSTFYDKYKSYEGKIAKLIEFRKAELIKEIGLTPKSIEEQDIKNIEKLIHFIKKELKHQDISDHELKFIGVNSKGELLNDLSISPSAAQIEKLLNSIVNNRLVRQKVTGEALVQVSNSLFEPENATAEELAQFGQKGLRSYRRDPKTGKTLGMDVKIAMQGKFMKLINLEHTDGKRVAFYTKKQTVDDTGKVKVVRELDEAKTLQRLNEVIQNEAWRSNQDNIDMITMVGVRIPVQGLNSMESMVVKEFLPTSAGNIIVPPIEIVAKSGSDFDIDKLTIMMPSIQSIGGKPSVVRESKKITKAESAVDKVEAIKLEIKQLKEDKRNAFKARKESQAELNEFLDPINELQKETDRLEALYQSLSGIKNPTQANIELLEKVWEKYNISTDKEDALIDALDNYKQELGLTSDKISNEEAEAIQTKIDKLTHTMNSIGSEAVENALIFSIRDILALEHNFVSLITPNSTDLVKPNQEDINARRKKNNEYSDQIRVWDEDRSSTTSYFEVAYNISKHESNSVGKETLGLGAVGNTWNTIFNRIGAYMDDTYTTGSGKSARKVRIKLLMDHNKKGDTGISLSHLYDVKGIKEGNKIADIINQLMNGWVDVAKDDWIFDIQGNKQVTPVLVFMLEAGVTFDNAVAFASNPLVKDYVNEQKKALSSFANPLGLNPKTASLYRENAKAKVLTSIGLGGLVKETKAGKISIKAKALQKVTEQETHGKKFTEQLMKSVADNNLAGARVSSNAKAAFLHFLELEKVANALTEVKLNLNYDTSKSNSLFESAETEAKLRTTYNNSILPGPIIKAILDESPIGSFRVGKFQLNLWSKLFPVRNNPAVNSYLISQLTDFNVSNNMAKLYGSTENYVENFKNDLIVKMFTDAEKGFNINAPTYKDQVLVNTDSTDIPGIDRGVTIYEGKMYVNKRILATQFSNELYTTNQVPENMSDSNKALAYANLKMAPVKVNAFTHISNPQTEYNRFVMEREYQRALTPYTKEKDTTYFKYKEAINTEKYKNKANHLSVEEKATKLKSLTYEEILRDRALDNILNNWKLFKSDATIADQIFEIKDMHPKLEKKYNIVRDLIISQLDEVDANKKVVGTFKNTVLRDNRVPVENMDIYHHNMTELSNPDVYSIPIRDESIEADQIENRRLAKFFSLLPAVGLLQSGLEAKSNLSIMKAMPMDKIADTIRRVSPNYQVILNDSEKAEEFLEQYNTVFNNTNSYKNKAVRRRFKNYTPNVFDIIDIENEVELSEEVDATSDSQLSLFEDINSIFTAKNVSIADLGITQEQWDVLTTDEKENIKSCN